VTRCPLPFPWIFSLMQMYWNVVIFVFSHKLYILSNLRCFRWTLPPSTSWTTLPNSSSSWSRLDQLMLHHFKDYNNKCYRTFLLYFQEKVRAH
jgi:hypothetical protein